jgi:hypothetical protein
MFRFLVVLRDKEEGKGREVEGGGSIGIVGV